MKSKIFILFSLTILMAGCISQLKQVKDPNTPFERPSYSILPPSGDHWSYIDREQTGSFNLSFGKKLDSTTHSLVAAVAEQHSLANFNSPEEYLKFVKQISQMGTDPRRFRIQKEEISLNNKFGPYSVLYHAIAEDHNAVNKGDAEYLLMENYGYFFLHPNFENIMIEVTYSERGKPNEVDLHFKEAAERFIEGLKLKSK